jgi:hypothetical protein
MKPKEAITLVKECGLNIEGIKHDECEKVILNALEKQIPKKPTPQIVKGGKRLIGNGWWCNGTTVYKCPNCNDFISRTYDYCYKCGQALDWSDTK